MRGALEGPSTEDVAALLVGLTDARGSRSPADALGELMVASEDEDGSRLYRPATEEERGLVWLPDPFPALTIEAMECRYYPVWRVLIRPGLEGRQGPPLLVEVMRVDAPASGPTGVKSVWRLVARPWPMILDGTGGQIPDFRPVGRRAQSAGSAGRGLVVVYPPWVVSK
jgi:hypothetical protein